MRSHWRETTFLVVAAALWGWYCAASEGSVRLRIVDAAGRPVVSAQIHGWYALDEFTWKVDRRGCWQFDDPDWLGQGLEVRAPGYEPARVRLQDGRAQLVTLTTDPG